MRSFKNEEEALDFLTKEIVWGNAAGTCREPDFAIKCAQTGMPAVMFGSITALPRMGNTGGDFYYDQETGNSINNCGLPNQGFDECIKIIPSLQRRINDLGSKLRISISAGDSFSAGEYWEMSRRLAVCRIADGVEGNFSCPNIKAGDERKLPICFNLSDFEAGVGSMCLGIQKVIPVAVKIAPVIDATFLGQLVDICLKYGVDYIVCSNTLDSHYSMMGIEKSIVPPGLIHGGLAGRLLRPIVCNMIQTIKPKIEGTKTKIITVGGIETASDAFEYLCLGEGKVVGFQFNTALSRRGNDLRFVGDLITGKDKEPGLLELLVKYGLPWED